MHALSILASVLASLHPATAAVVPSKQPCRFLVSATGTNYTRYIGTPKQQRSIPGVAYAWLVASPAAALLAHPLAAAAGAPVVFANSSGTLDLPMQLSYLDANLYNASVAREHLSPNSNFSVAHGVLAPVGGSVDRLVACRNTTGRPGAEDQLFWHYSEFASPTPLGCLDVTLAMVPVECKAEEAAAEQMSGAWSFVVGRLFGAGVQELVL